MELQLIKRKQPKEKGSPTRKEVAYSKLLKSSWRMTRPSRPSTSSVGNQGRRCLRSPLHEAIFAHDVPGIERILSNSVGDYIDSFDEEGMAPLHQAAKQGLCQVIPSLLNHDASVNLKNVDGSTALHVALRYSREDVALALINGGADASLIDSRGLNSLHTAAKEGLPTIVRKLSEGDLIDVDARDKNLNTALHHAVVENDVQSCNILLENKASVDICNETGETPLHIAVSENYTDIIDLLIETKRGLQGASDTKDDKTSIESFINKPRKDMKTAVFLAAEMGHITAMQKLIEEGADIFVQSSTKTTLLHLTASAGNENAVRFLLKKGISSNTVNNKRRTPLHEAVRFGQLSITEMLLDAKTDIEQQDFEGCTPYMLAAKNGHIRIANALLKHGAKVTTKELKLKNALHFAVENGNLEMAMFLVERCKKLIHAKDEGQHSPVHYAARSGNLEILRLFKSHSRQLFDTDDTGETALHIAARYGHESCVNELSENAEDTIINITNPQGETPLHIAVINRQMAVCKVLLKNKAVVDCKDKNNWTPLHHATTHDDATAVKLLLKRRAEIDSEDNWGNTSLMTGAKAGNVAAVVMLLQHGAQVELTNQDGDTFLDIAIDFRKEAVCKAALEDDRWKEILTSKDPNGRNFIDKLVDKFPNLAEIILDRSTMFSDHHPEHPDFFVTFDYQFLEEEPDSHSLMTDTLAVLTKQRNKLYFAPKLMAKHGCESMMAHPITADLFATKWRRICRYFYYASFVIYIFYIISMTYLVIKENNTFVKVADHRARRNTSSSSEDSGLTELINTAPSSKNYGKVIGSLILAFCCFQLCKELLQMIVLRWKYFMSFTNYLELCLYSVNLYYIAIFFAISVVNRQLSEIGVICIFLGWTNLLLYLQRVSMFRLYIVMFIKVSVTIIRLLVVFGIIILAFAFTFYLLFIRQTTYRSPLASTAKVLVMMTGEFDFDDAISSKLGQREPKTKFPYVPYPILSYVIFVIFVFLVAVAFTNLLIGLAVGDIDAIRKIATVSIFEQQLEFIESIQGIVPKYILKKRVYIPANTYLVNRKTTFQRWKETLLPDSTDENLKKLRMKLLESDSRRVSGEQNSAEFINNTESERQTHMEDVFL